MAIDEQKDYQQWAQQVNMPVELKAELSEMKNDSQKIKDAFGTTLSFGTAGMRGIMGAGINRMNIYTVRQATEGLAQYMDTLNPSDKARGVAVSFDSRYHSKEFAYEAAKVLGAHGINSYVFDDIRPTPELSFTIRHLHTYAGIMITASHNPKQYNGYKIYGEDGGQMPPKASNLITEYIRKASDVFQIPTVPVKQLRKDQTLNLIGEAVDQAYLKNAEAVNVNHDLIKKEGKDLKFVYTPLHGTGKVLVRRALENAGFQNYEIEPKQAITDPEFPTTPYPNPEFKQTFDLPIQLGQKIGADVLIATDPDADRLGAAVRQPNGDYHLMTGNQIASVLLDYILKAKQDSNTLPKNGTIVKSIVSTELATKIAENYHVHVKNVLTGFKYIAEQIKEYEKNNDRTFLFGFEESYGYLIKPFVRDKDAIQSTMLLAEVAAYYKSKDMTLYDGLQAIYQKYGYFAENTTSKSFEGVDANDQMNQVMKNLRNQTLTEFNSQPVTTTEDFLSSQKKYNDGQVEKIELPTSNVLKYWLADGTWITVRPSGTEPKVKFYVGTYDKSSEKANRRLESYEAAIQELIKSVTNNK